MAKKPNVTIKMGLDGWIMTYGDMMSLLLTFFVLIVSFSSMQESKFEQAAESLKEAFGVMAHPQSVIELNRPLVPRTSDRQADLEFLYEVRNLEKELIERNLDDQVEVQTRQDGVIVQMPAPMLFKSGRAELLDTTQPLLEQLARLFRKFPGEVRVEGHTDDVPIHSAQFPSNWELSSARAVAVARYFQGVGIPADRLAATGFGEHRPKVSNDTPAGRAVNRRVEILLARADTPDTRQGGLPVVDSEPPPAPAEAAPAPEPDETLVPLPIYTPVTGRLGGAPLNHRK